jgi:cobyrinic acid a,c-diamide synthase
MSKPYLIYLGGGFLPEVPARDLTKEEAEHFDVAALLASGLYKLEDKKERKKEEEA